MLATAPAVAYREYLYRPGGRFARWISDRFDVVGRPGQPVDRPPQPGDVLLEVTLGRAGPGRCVALEAGDPQVDGGGAKARPGQLLLRPLKRADMSDPLPVEPGRPGVHDPRDLAYPEGAESGRRGESQRGAAGVAAARLPPDG